MKKRTTWVIAIAAAVAVMAIVAVGLFIASKGDNSKVTEQMELAQRYLDELDYEQAIATYKVVLEIDPNNIEAYHGMAEAYIALGDYEAAADILREGIEITSSEELRDLLKEVEAKMNRAEDVEKTEPEPVPVPEKDETITEEYPDLHVVSDVWEFESEDTEIYYDTLRTVVEQNKYGDDLKWTTYNSKGVIVHVYEYTYYEPDKQKTNHFYYYDVVTGELVSGRYIEIDENGREVLWQELGADGTLQGEEKHVYSADGSYSEDAWGYGEYDDFYHYYRERDSLDREIYLAIYAESGDLIWDYRNEYAEDGSLTVYHVNFSEEGKCQWQEKFDAYGRRTYYEVCFPNSSIISNTEECIYYEDGSWTQHSAVYYEDGSLNWTYDLNFNADGSLKV